MSKGKSRVLIFIDWFLPGYKAGGPIQSCANLIAHLKDEFDFWVITRDTDYCEKKPYPAVRSNEWNQLEENVQVYYISEDKLCYSELAKAVAEANPDTAFINGIYSFYFSILPLVILRSMGHVHTIVSARGMLAPSAVNVKGNKKKLFLKVAKSLGLYRNVRFHATNDIEKQHIQDIFGKTQPVIVAPNLPKPAKTGSIVKRDKLKGELKLVSIARISPEKNTKYALEALEDCRFDGSILFDIYGPIYNEAYWEECQEVIKRLPDNISVNYKGSLDSSKVVETLCRYHAMFMPTRGENFGHIILESFSSGCPVLISDQTPWKGLSALKVGYDLPLSNTEGFVQTIQTLLLKEQDVFDMWSEQAFNYAQQFIHNKEAVEQNHQMFSKSSNL
ncbi:glycosyltransferase family 4 protein [Pontibacter ruber]|uniref:Glycosyltransferase family 4 protein n=1 Tax=Pontibacter ruber TaxID=1343895 RepID=A0ABW5CUJ1_9BACT|nr:glycosyltransferase [Pontibacter ruber]